MKFMIVNCVNRKTDSILKKSLKASEHRIKHFKRINLLPSNDLYCLWLTRGALNAHGGDVILAA